jgi:hypothetical protein
MTLKTPCGVLTFSTSEDGVFGGASRVAQVVEHLPSRHVSPEFNPQYCQKGKKKMMHLEQGL